MRGPNAKQPSRGLCCAREMEGQALGSSSQHSSTPQTRRDGDRTARVVLAEPPRGCHWRVLHPHWLGGLLPGTPGLAGSSPLLPEPGTVVGGGAGRPMVPLCIGSAVSRPRPCQQCGS